MSHEQSLSSVENFRDIAGEEGSSYQNIHDQPLRRGVFYRSNVLRPSDTDLATLSALGLKAIVDLRTKGETEMMPDKSLPGATYVHIGVIDDATQAFPEIETAEDADQWMLSTYGSFVADDAVRSRLCRVLESLSEGEAPQVFHCTSGKDRTGWVAALLLTIAEVPRDVIVEDFMLSNDRLASFNEAIYERIVAAKGEAFAKTVAGTFGVSKQWLDHAFTEAERRFGSMQGYLQEGLGLSDARQAQLKKQMLG